MASRRLKRTIRKLSKRDQKFAAELLILQRKAYKLDLIKMVLDMSQDLDKTDKEIIDTIIKIIYGNEV